VPRIKFLTECNFDCHQHLSAQEPGNMVVSPVSIKLVLAMLYEGAAGNTALELEQTLQLPARLQARKRFSAILDSLLVSIPVPSASISSTNHRSSSDQQRPTSFISRSLKHASKHSLCTDT
jgi:serine protease inhibitor